MNNIAVLITCHNRKEKTVSCLKSLYICCEEINQDFKMTVYLTDDGSSDGTCARVNELFSEVKIFHGSGSLFWTGGMLMSWNAAISVGYDGYLLLNDDVILVSNFFEILLDSITQTNSKAILIGSTKDDNSGDLTYGGSVFSNKFKGTYQLKYPNGYLQNCELGNANIMYVPESVVDKIGVLTSDYIHGYSDYDYTLRAVKAKIGVLILPVYCGYCSSHEKGKYDIFYSFNDCKSRKLFLFSPTGLAFSDHLHFQKTFFPWRVIPVLILGYVKIYLPKFYKNLNALIR